MDFGGEGPSRETQPADPDGLAREENLISWPMMHDLYFIDHKHGIMVHDS